VLPFHAGEKDDALEFHQKMVREAIYEGAAVEVSVPLIRVGDRAALRVRQLGGVDIPTVGEAEWGIQQKDGRQTNPGSGATQPPSFPNEAFSPP
jgi:hypothetical protein